MKILKLFICVSVCISLQAMEFPYHPTHEIKLISGLQINEHPVTTKSKEAQRFFNQGLNLVYGFNHDQAYWSFQKAVALDPDFAMGYWGMALALGPNINMDITGKSEKIAFEHIQKARELFSHITESEKDYINALSKRYTDADKPDLKELNLNYNAAMKHLMLKYPDDPDAAVLYAESGLDLNPWRQWTTAGDPMPGTLEIVEVLESVLKRQPRHLGANHYYIHAIEASKHPEYALINAERLRKLVPALGHIMHMPSHIYLLVGDYHLASLANEAAIAADLSYIREFGTGGIYPVHYLSHNYFFLVRSLTMEGRFKAALRTANELINFYLPHFQEMPELEYYLFSKLSVLLRFHKWDEIIELPNPDPDHKMPITGALWHFARGKAFAGRNDEKNALLELSAFNKAKAKIPEDKIFGLNPVKTLFGIASNVLEAKIAKLQMNYTKEITLLQDAVKIQDTLNYNEPPDWYFPVRESLGAALLQNRQFKEAEEVFRQDLKLHPKNGRALFGLLLSLQEQGRDADSFFVQREFDQAWEHSDSPFFYIFT